MQHCTSSVSGGEYVEFLGGGGFAGVGRLGAVSQAAELQRLGELAEKLGWGGLGAVSGGGGDAATG